MSVINNYDASTDKMGFAGCILRLSGHDLMDFRYHFPKNPDGSFSLFVARMTGGVDGCLDFEDGDNAGLDKCSEKHGFLDAYNEHCDKLSVADYMVIATEATLSRTRVQG